jgi:hypothetical protein
LDFNSHKMKPFSLLLLFLLATSCQVSETISINNDGSGSIVFDQLQDENFRQNLNLLRKEPVVDKEVFKDTTYTFGDYLTKYSKTFLVIPVANQKVFQRYAAVKVRTKQSSYDKEFRTTFSQNFANATEICDLYKTEDYTDDIINSYALTAEEHYYSVSYTFENSIFKRIVKIKNQEFLKKEVEKINEYKTHYLKFNPIQSYVLNYNFPRKIKSVSNPKAKISEDKKSLVLDFLIADCLQNPEITNLEVVLED